MNILPLNYSGQSELNNNLHFLFRNNMDQLYQEFFRIWMPSENILNPAVNLHENDDNFIATIEVPGVYKDLDSRTKCNAT